MMLQVSKSQIALAVTAAVASFVAVGQFMHYGRALPSVPPQASPASVADAAPTITPQASAPPATRLEARNPERQAGPRGACRQDVRQLCGDAAPGQGRIVRCLAEHRGQISESCRTAMLQRRMERQQQRQALQGWRSQRNGAPYGQARRERWTQPSAARIISVPGTQTSPINE